MIDRIYIEENLYKNPICPTLYRTDIWLHHCRLHRENRHELIAEQLKPRNVPMLCL